MDSNLDALINTTKDTIWVRWRSHSRANLWCFPRDLITTMQRHQFTVTVNVVDTTAHKKRARLPLCHSDWHSMTSTTRSTARTRHLFCQHLIESGPAQRNLVVCPRRTNASASCRYSCPQCPSRTLSSTNHLRTIEFIHRGVEDRGA